MRDHDPLERMIVPRLASHPRQENGSCKDLERERRDLERLGFLMRERLVLADTGRLNYLVLIGASELLPKLLTRPGRRRRFAPNCAIIVVRTWPRRRSGLRCGRFRAPPWTSRCTAQSIAGTAAVAAGARHQRRPHFDRRPRCGRGRPRFWLCRDRYPGCGAAR